MFPATVTTVKCPSGRNNCGNSYNSLTFNRRISLYTTTQYTKTEEMFLAVLEKYFSTPFPLVLRSFLPPTQDIASLAYPDGFHQAQAVWLHETRQDGLSAPFADIHRNGGLVCSVTIRLRRSLNCNKPVITWPFRHLANLSPSGTSRPCVIN